MKKALIAIAFVLVVAIIGGAFYLAKREYVFRVSEAQIQENLAAKLPVSKTFFFIFQLTFDHPRVTLVGESGRVHAGLDVVLNIVLGNESKPLGGTLDVSGGVLYSPERGAFFLTDPLIERFAIDGMPEKYREKVNAALTKAIAAFFAEQPIYALRATDTRQAAARLVLKSVAVENRELVVTLGR